MQEPVDFELHVRKGELKQQAMHLLVVADLQEWCGAGGPFKDISPMSSKISPWLSGYVWREKSKCARQINAILNAEYEFS
ncbi:hypothetical protein NC652_029188 [Populus alba x Populus x berolinensis]|nr:hypothetical protein NC652_029188 [Populus alba x Populus x berolinensis]